MKDVTLVGIDLGKHSFHLHGQDRDGRAVFRKKLGRQQMMQFLGNLPCCMVAMEACAGAHFIARELIRQGHQIRLIAPQFVKPFVKGNKNDFIDAEAICEAASRPSMRFVAVKAETQQTLSVLHRIRDALIRDRTKTANQVHGFLLEFGVSLPKGLSLVRRLPAPLADKALPAQLTSLLNRLHEHFCYLDEQISQLDKELNRLLAEDDLGTRLMTIPCIGPVTASILSAEMGDGKQYGSSRDFAASLGLVPRQYSTGGRNNLLGISKRGDKNIRRLMVQCARVYLQRLEHQTGRLADWVQSLKQRRHSNVVVCALANKFARIAWVLATRHEVFEIESGVISA